MRILARSIVVILAAGICTISVSNIPKVSLAIMIMMNDNDYKRGNYHFSAGSENQFSIWSVKGYEDVLEAFDKFKKTQPANFTLYRNFTPQYWKFWRWYAYSSEAQYALPYKNLSPEEIRKVMVRSKYE